MFIVLIAKDEGDMNAILDVVFSLFRKWRLRVNSFKFKLVHYGKRLRKEVTMYLASREIFFEYTTSYMYFLSAIRFYYISE